MNLAGGKIELKMTNMVFGPPQCSIQVILYIYHIYQHTFRNNGQQGIELPTQISKRLNLQMTLHKLKTFFYNFNYYIIRGNLQMS